VNSGFERNTEVLQQWIRVFDVSGRIVQDFAKNFEASYISEHFICDISVYYIYMYKI